MSVAINDTNPDHIRITTIGHTPVLHIARDVSIVFDNHQHLARWADAIANTARRAQPAPTVTPHGLTDDTPTVGDAA